MTGQWFGFFFFPVQEDKQASRLLEGGLTSSTGCQHRAGVRAAGGSVGKGIQSEIQTGKDPGWEAAGQWPGGPGGPAACLCPGTLAPWVERQPRLGQGKALSRQVLRALTGNPPPGRAGTLGCTTEGCPGEGGARGGGVLSPPGAAGPVALRAHRSEGLPSLPLGYLGGGSPPCAGSLRPVLATLGGRGLEGRRCDPSLPSGCCLGGEPAARGAQSGRHSGL